MLSYSCMNIEERKNILKKNESLIKQGHKETAHYLAENIRNLNRQLTEMNKLSSELGLRTKIDVPIDEPDEVRMFEEAFEDAMNNYKYELYNHNMTVDGVDISKKLSMIRYCNCEISMILAIGKNSILDYAVAEGDAVFTCAPMGKEIETLINKYKDDPDVLLYEVHNHPYLVSAKPSELDVKHCQSDTTKWNLVDWGVVTEYDYYSHNQDK